MKNTQDFCEGIVEWIINPEGSLYLVDYKQPGPNFISNIGQRAPEEFLIYQRPELALVLPSTSIEYLDALEQSPEGLKFMFGSPLSHVCLEAFYKKIPTSVANVTALEHLDDTLSITYGPYVMGSYQR